MSDTTQKRPSLTAMKDFSKKAVAASKTKARSSLDRLYRGVAAGLRVFGGKSLADR
ncbi:hypothetical protein [Roseomonas elaeocarpi]|uniref:Uncharacterized protein n=1 Tax=Roseomonas elaeocarpi TaxID=907779 RepID=A0ABV6JRB1_9PROT